MVSQIERGERPVPTKPRPLYPGAEEVLHDPSIREDIEEVLGLEEDELRQLFGNASRGPYRS